MQIVIDIPESTYKVFKNLSRIIGVLVYEKDILTLIKAVKNGTPLPQGHGRLIDADKFLKDNEAYTGFILDSRVFGGKNVYKDALEDLVDEAPTIIKADKGGEE